MGNNQQIYITIRSTSTCHLGAEKYHPLRVGNFANLFGYFDYV
jgi:hypothetical protein